jgi:hypothetical protein
MAIKSFTLPVLGLLIQLLPGCSNDLNLLYPAPPVPVVICFVNPTDSFCYVTVSRSITAESDATEFLHNNHQMEINDAEITLEAWGSEYKLWETHFSHIDSYVSNNEPQMVARSNYKSDQLLLFPNPTIVGSHEGWDYDFFRLQVKSPQFKDIVYARIPIIVAPKRIYPVSGIDFNLYGSEESYFRVKLNLDETRYASFVCQFYFQEFTDKWVDRCAQFVVRKDLALLTDALTIRLTEETIFNKLSASIKNDAGVYARLFSHMDFTLLVADEFFDDYFDTYLNVSSHDINVYTNITNGYGLFSMVRTVNFQSVKFDKQTLDSLCFGRLTKSLHFKLW